jgi:hypothetical protein
MFPELQRLMEEKEMNNTMTISLLQEEGIYLLREGDEVLRVNKDGEVECTNTEDPPAFQLLPFIQKWKTPSRRIFQEYPFTDFPT